MYSRLSRLSSPPLPRLKLKSRGTAEIAKKQNNMGNGRRLGGGGGGGGGRNQRVLRQRIESCKSKYPTADDIVPYLRERYSDYRRMEQRALMRLVKNILHNSASPQPSKRPPPVPASSYDEETAPGQRRQQKRARGEEDEKRLQRIEKEHSRRRFSKNQSDSGADTESESESESESGPSSTSEDGVYGERVEPEFDLFRSMLRDSYAGETKEKNMELEIASANFKEENKMEMPMTGDGGKGEVGGGGEGLRKGKEKDCSAGVEVGQGKEGWPRFRDLGGIREVLEELEVEVFVPLYHPHVLQRLGVNPVSGILLHGPPGCGKTKLAHAIANETGVPFYRISAPEVVSGVSGSSEENIRNLFSKAYRTAPSIIFIDEIDSIASKRDNVQKDMERRIVTQLMTCMDEFHKLQKSSNGISDSEDSDQSPGFVLVIGATNRPDAIDPALRRPGRFDREIKLSIPDENARVEILKVLTKRYTLDGSLDLLRIARATPGFVGADLVALVNKAGYLAMRRILSQRKSELSRDYADKERNEYWWKVPWLPEEIEKLAITMADFEKAVKAVQPSSKREGFSDIPDVNWGDVGGLDSIRKEFDLHIVRPIKCPELYKKFGVKLETGILLYGPPGCGKTLIAKAAANEAGANFITIKGPELLNKYVGESELAVRTLFNRARTCSPCVLFFDEVDALTTKRGKEGGWVVERLLNQLLIELDGADQRSGVFVIGATNRPEVIDPAVLRPGRFGKLLYVPLPSSDDRGLILKALAKKEKPIDPSVDLSAIGQMKACENFSGADLKNLMNEAALVAMEDAHRDGGSDDILHTIKATHFEQALGKIYPSVSQEQVEFYKIWSENFRSG